MVYFWYDVFACAATIQTHTCETTTEEADDDQHRRTGTSEGRAA